MLRISAHRLLPAIISPNIFFNIYIFFNILPDIISENREFEISCGYSMWFWTRDRGFSSAF